MITPIPEKEKKKRKIYSEQFKTNKFSLISTFVLAWRDPKITLFFPTSSSSPTRHPITWISSQRQIEFKSCIYVFALQEKFRIYLSYEKVPTPFPPQKKKKLFSLNVSHVVEYLFKYFFSLISCGQFRNDKIINYALWWFASVRTNDWRFDTFFARQFDGCLKTFILSPFFFLLLHFDGEKC